MKRLVGAIVVVTLCCCMTATAQQYDSMYNASVVNGRVGDTEIHLYLGPSPFISEAAVNFIKAASNNLEVCVYELNIPEVLDALLQAHKRGVAVRVAVHPASVPSEHDRYMWEKYNRLITRGILKPTENKSGLMHNKFMVRDKHTFWTGSYNLTKNDTEMNDNNVITFTHPELAENYMAEFEEIWNGQHGKRNSTPTPNPKVMIGDIPIHNLFGPEDDLEKAVVSEVRKATNSIYIMAFALSNKQLFRAITDKANEGVKVYTLFDLELARHKSSLSRVLQAEGVSVRISANNGQMHHKVIVVDENVVITGSANFSASGYNSNDENIIIFESPPLARAFMRECARCWLAKPYVYNKWSTRLKK